MATLNVRTTPGAGEFATIRAALIAAGNGDTINIGPGTFSIVAAGYNNSLAYSATPNCSTGFINGVTSLTYTGAGKTSTTITGNARLFGQNVDGTAPLSVSYSNFGLSYSGGSGYILSTLATPSITISGVSFTGSHSGNAGASGNYADVRNVTSFTLSNSDVSLTGQAGFTGSSGGSSFLMLQGSGISITGNTFDEAGYRNALSIFDSSAVMVLGNTFSRSSNRNVRSGGEKLKDTSGTVSGNKFLDGAYLAIEKTSAGGSKTVNITGNTFAQFEGALNPVNGTNPAVGIVLQGANAATALGTVTGNTFSYVAPFSNTTATAITVNSSNASSNTYIDPITNTSKNFNAYRVGGTGNDPLTGVSTPEYFIGGAGNDSINLGGSSNGDYILFNTAYNSSTNLDTITGFNNTSRIILDRKIFTGITATYNPSGTVGSNAIGAVNNSTQVENNTTGTASSAGTRIIFNTSTKELLYDPDGVGGTSATAFAVLTGYTGTMVGYNGSNLSNVNIGII